MSIFRRCGSILAAMVLAGCGGAPSSKGVSGGDALGAGDAGVAGDAAEAAPQFVYGPPTNDAGLPGILSSLQIVTTTWTRDTEDITAQVATAFGPPGIESSAW